MAAANPVLLGLTMYPPPRASSPALSDSTVYWDDDPSSSSDQQLPSSSRSTSASYTSGAYRRVAQSVSTGSLPLSGPHRPIGLDNVFFQFTGSVHLPYLYFSSVPTKLTPKL
ncbi:uncharacterized protein EHS24_005968 [Apiotrichum porosum]|uniref:Uncharacterized protein n=1 Tax=Apiotrichum porosum TaxID=105984 RepID=A0A427Y035_9TREE|nr:uncharacterized protein EHS24_005968 [Apiotrichum porosum]RSH84447.1 hypothetical protein EHS24_005968 [Apiotrichum porosum]